MRFVITLLVLSVALFSSSCTGSHIDLGGGARLVPGDEIGKVLVANHQKNRVVVELNKSRGTNVIRRGFVVLQDEEIVAAIVIDYGYHLRVIGPITSVYGDPIKPGDLVFTYRIEAPPFRWKKH